MRLQNRQFIVSGRHRRLQMLWQVFFSGWGLIMVAMLAASPFLMKSLLFSPIAIIDMHSVNSNQFRMVDAKFSGTDENGQPFSINVATARQEYDDPEKVFMETVRANIVQDGQKTNITSNNGVFDRAKKTVILTGNVRVKSEGGDNLQTKELVIKL